MKDIVEEALGRLNSGDLEGYLGLYHPDVVMHGATRDPLRGREALRGYYLALLASFSPAKVVPVDIIAEGDKAVCRFMFHGRHSGPFLNIAPTGRDVVAQGITIIRFDGGLGVERWTTFDTLALLTQVSAG